MDAQTEKRIVKIGKALGANGRHFTVEEIQKLDEYMLDGEIKYAMSQLIMDEQIAVSVEDGELFFSMKK